MRDRTEEVMQQLAKGLDTILNGEAEPKQNGFLLLVFPIGGDQANYVSNCMREDTIPLLQDLLERWKQ